MCRASMQRRALLLAALLGALATVSTAATGLRQQHAAAHVVSLFGEPRPSGARVLFQHPSYQPFDRPVPQALEASLVEDFEVYYNETQELHAKGPNRYVPSGRPFVAEIDGGCVRGILGDVYDSQKRVFSEFTTPTVTPPAWNEGQTRCKRFKRLANPIQRYGHMYFHFMQEVLPRVILMRPLLKADPTTKLLMFGAPYEFEWLSALGIPKEQVEVYDPSQCYCADSLVVPTLSPSMMPPKENYIAVRAALLPDRHSNEQRKHKQDVIVYCSRNGSNDRQVSNEAAILSAIATQHPTAELVVYRGTEGVQGTIQIFRRASIVLGMHGAGLSHIIFSDPGTTVIEFLFMSAPPLMFWHAASALHQRYMMVPLAQSWWLQPTVEVPIMDVLDAVAVAMKRSASCPQGFGLNGGQCAACTAGTYSSPASDTCQPCAPGRFATSHGAAHCRTCPVGSFSLASATACSPCQEGSSTLFPGAPSSELCVSAAKLSTQADQLYSDEALAKKLVSLPTPTLSTASLFLGWLNDALSSIGEWFSPTHSSDSNESPSDQHHSNVLTKYLDQLLEADSDADDNEANSAFADQKEADDEFALLRMLSKEEQHNPDSLAGVTPELSKKQRKDMEEHQQAAAAAAANQQAQAKEKLAWRPKHAVEQGAEGAPAHGSTQPVAAAQEEVPAWRRYLQTMEGGYGRMLQGYRRSMVASGSAAQKATRKAKRQRQLSVKAASAKASSELGEGSRPFSLEAGADATVQQGGVAGRRRSAVARAAAERAAKRSRQLSNKASDRRGLMVRGGAATNSGPSDDAAFRVTEASGSYAAIISGVKRRSLAEPGAQLVAKGMATAGRKQGGGKKRAGPQGQGQGQGGKGKGKRQGGQGRKGGASQQKRRQQMVQMQGKEGFTA